MGRCAVKLSHGALRYRWTVCESFRRDGRYTVDVMPRGDFMLSCNGRDVSRHVTQARAKSAVLVRDCGDGFCLGGYLEAVRILGNVGTREALTIADALTWEGQAEL